METDRPEEAWATLQAITLPAVHDMDRSFYWWTIMVALANTVVQLDQPEWAELLRALMAPYREHNSTVGQALFMGAASHHLGVLACSLQEWDEAVDYLEPALDRHRAMGAQPFVALTSKAYASALAGRDRPGDRKRARELQEAAACTARDLQLRALALRDVS